VREPQVACPSYSAHLDELGGGLGLGLGDGLQCSFYSLFETLPIQNPLQAHDALRNAHGVYRVQRPRTFWLALSNTPDSFMNSFSTRIFTSN